MARSAAKKSASSDDEKKERPMHDIRVPMELELVKYEIVKACKHDEDPRSWPEEEPPVTVLRAYGPEAIARPLIKAYHVSIRKSRIAYLWAEHMGNGTKTILGKAMKAPARWAFLAELDFVIVFNHSAWRILTVEQKVALVDHELAHLDIDGETAKAVIVPHDVEEFGAIVKRHGLWKPDLRTFGDAVKGAMQIDIWDQPLPPPAASTIKPIGEIMKTVVDKINAGELGADVTAKIVARGD